MMNEPPVRFSRNAAGRRLRASRLPSRDPILHQRPADGFYVTFWRLLLRHPELLHWEHLYHESCREVYRVLYARVKSVKKDALFGLHIWTNTSMSPIYRAEQDFSELSKCADFLKLALYNNCGGPRMASYIQSIGDTVYGDLSPAEALQFHYRILNYPNEAPYPAVSDAGLSADYVYREVKRALDGRGEGTARILAGIDVDIPPRILMKEKVVAIQIGAPSFMDGCGLRAARSCPGGVLAFELQKRSRVTGGRPFDYLRGIRGVPPAFSPDGKCHRSRVLSAFEGPIGNLLAVSPSDLGFFTGLCCDSVPTQPTAIPRVSS